MNCPKCNGLIATKEIFAENIFIDDIYCLSCGERFFKDIPLEKLKSASRKESTRIELLIGVNWKGEQNGRS